MGEGGSITVMEEIFIGKVGMGMDKTDYYTTVITTKVIPKLFLHFTILPIVSVI